MQRVTNNWNLKLMAFVLAVALWSHVRGEVNPWETATFKVHLAHDPPPRMILVGDTKLPATVDVTVRAPRQTLREIKGNALANPLGPVEVTPGVSEGLIRAGLDFSKARRGEQTVPVKVAVNIEDAEYLGAKPSDVDVVLDQATSTRVPVEPDFGSTVNVGYRVANVKLAPDLVELSGPSNALNHVARVVARVKLQQLAPGVERALRVPVVALDADGQVVDGISLDPAAVQVTGTLLENRVTRRIRVAPGWKGSPAPGYRVTDIEIMPARITVRGPQRTLDKMASLAAPIDLDGATTAMSRRVNVMLPPGVTATDVKQVLVKVQIARSTGTGLTGTGLTEHTDGVAGPDGLPQHLPGETARSQSAATPVPEAAMTERVPAASGAALPPPAMKP